MMLLPFIAVLPGCRKVEAIPEDLDGVVHFLWDNLDAGSDEVLVDGVVGLHAAMGGATLEEATDGTLSVLTAEEVEALGTGRDPSSAAGIFLGNVIDCEVDVVAEIVTWPAQEDLYSGVYDSYARDYDGDIQAFLDGDADTLRWSIDYGASVLGSSYRAHSRALLRRVVPAAEVDAPFTEAYLVRFHAPDPAVFEEGSNKSFEQDYQFEIYWNRGSSETLHGYAMWRQASWGAGFTSDDQSVQRILLNNMEGWDRDTDDICAAGGPSAMP